MKPFDMLEYARSVVLGPERRLDPYEPQHVELTERLLRDKAYQEWPEDRLVRVWLHDQPEHMQSIAQAAIAYQATPYQATKDELSRSVDAARQDYIDARMQSFTDWDGFEILRSHLERG
jgi:hypothetical protein